MKKNFLEEENGDEFMFGFVIVTVLTVIFLGLFAYFSDFLLENEQVNFLKREMRPSHIERVDHGLYYVKRNDTTYKVRIEKMHITEKVVVQK